MMKRLMLTFAVLVFSITPVFEANSSEPLAILFEATDVPLASGSELVLLPRVAPELNRGGLSDRARVAFDMLKNHSPAHYGQTVVRIDPDKAVLALDPNRRDSWDRIASEVFATFTGLGIKKVYVPALSSDPLSSGDLRTPTYVLTIPYYDALPPRVLPESLVVIEENRMMTSGRFRASLKAGEPSLMAHVLAGLDSPVEAVRASILAAIPYLPIDERSEHLLPLLADPSTGVRLAVLKLLENEKVPEVNARLEGLIDSEANPTVKLAVARILVARGFAKYSVFIEMEKLSDPSADVVAGAIDRLAGSGNPAVAPSLVAALIHQSAKVRSAAVRGLVALSAGDAISGAVGDVAVMTEIREPLAGYLLDKGTPQQVSQGLSFLISGGSEAGAIKAIEKVAKAGPGSVKELLIKGLARSEVAVRSAALGSLRDLGDAGAIPTILDCANRNPTDRITAEDAVIGILAKQPVDRILALMQDKDVTTRRLAMKAFGDATAGTAPSAKAISVLQSRLSDADLGVRRAAVYALARVPDEAVAKSMMAMSKDPDEEIRMAAITAAIGSSDPSATGVIVEAIQDMSDKVKAVALGGIGQKRMIAAREQLKMLEAYQEVGVRRAAMKAYIDLMEPGTAAAELDFLTRLMFDTDPEIKMAAMAVVTTVHERRAINAVAALVIDPSLKVRMAAIDALASTKEKDAMEGIQKGVFDNDKGMRLHALEGLKKLGNVSAMDFLGELFQHEQDEDIIAKVREVQEALVQ